MRLICLGPYHNDPAGLHYDGPGEIELDEAKALFLLRDAPDNFKRLDISTEIPPQGKALDQPPADKMIRRAPKTK